MSDSFRIRGNGILITAALVVIAAGMKSAQDLMVPFLLATFIATIAATPMFWLQRRGLPSSIALPTVMVAMIVLIVLLGALVAQSASQFGVKLPEYQARLIEMQGDFVALIQPIIEPMGLSLVWFGIVTVIGAEIGLLTPPLGISCFVIKATLNRSDIALKDVFLGALPFAFVMLLVLILIIAYPVLSIGILG